MSVERVAYSTDKSLLVIYITYATMPDYNGNDFLEIFEDEDFLLFIATFKYSIATGECILSILIWLLHIQKGYSMTSIQDFTTYDFVNLRENKGEQTRFTGYQDWELSNDVMKLLALYIRQVSTRFFKHMK